MASADRTLELSARLRVAAASGCKVQITGASFLIDPQCARQLARLLDDNDGRLVAEGRTQMLASVKLYSEKAAQTAAQEMVDAARATEGAQRLVRARRERDREIWFWAVFLAWQARHFARDVALAVVGG